MTALTPTLLSHDEVRDLLPAYALGILEPDEAAEVRAHLADCADCRQELARYECVTDALATAPTPLAPPPTLRARLLDELQPRLEAPIETPPITISSPAPKIVAFPRWVIWPVAAAAVLLIAGVAVLGALLLDARGERNDARTGSAELASYLAAGGQATKLSAATTDGKYYGHGSLVTAPNHAPLIIVGGCSPTGENRVYRVWVARGDERTRVGELKVGSDGDGWLQVALADPLDSFETIGITMITDDDQRQDVLVAQVAPAVPS